jgi:hypothetical protein
MASNTAGDEEHQLGALRTEKEALAAENDMSKKKFMAVSAPCSRHRPLPGPYAPLVVRSCGWRGVHPQKSPQWHGGVALRGGSQPLPADRTRGISV